MKALISVIFGFGLIFNAALFVPQAWHLWKAKRADVISISTFIGFCAMQLVGALDGYYQRDRALLIGMTVTLVTCGTATGLAIYYSFANRGCRPKAAAGS